MPGHDIIVIGASAGGVDALPKLIGSLPKDLPASVFVVLHIAAQGPDLLPQIISTASALPVAHGIDREKIRPGRVYVAPPDCKTRRTLWSPAMPQSALRNVKVDHCLPLAEIGSLLVRLTTKRHLPDGRKE